MCHELICVSNSYDLQGLKMLQDSLEHSCDLLQEDFVALLQVCSAKGQWYRYIYIYIYIYICIYVYTYIYICKRLMVCMRVCVCTWTRVRVRVRERQGGREKSTVWPSCKFALRKAIGIHIYIYIYLNIYIHMYIYVYIQLHVQKAIGVYACVCLYVDVCA